MTIHPARLAGALAVDLPLDIAARLLAEPRFADRIDTLLPPHADLPEADRRVAAMDLPTLDRLALDAGVVIHATRILREIRGPVIAEWVDRFGTGTLALARAYADLALDRDPQADPEDDGRACLAAWIAALPPAAKARMHLVWPADAAVPVTTDPALLAQGPTVIRRLAGAV